MRPGSEFVLDELSNSGSNNTEPGAVATGREIRKWPG